MTWSFASPLIHNKQPICYLPSVKIPVHHISYGSRIAEKEEREIINFRAKISFMLSCCRGFDSLWFSSGSIVFLSTKFKIYHDIPFTISVVSNIEKSIKHRRLNSSLLP
jgi:hypothetical protein